MDADLGSKKEKQAYRSDFLFLSPVSFQTLNLKFPPSLLSLIISYKLGNGEQRAGVEVRLQAMFNCFSCEHDWDIIEVRGHRINFFCFHYDVYVSVYMHLHTHVLVSIYGIYLFTNTPLLPPHPNLY